MHVIGPWDNVLVRDDAGLLPMEGSIDANEMGAEAEPGKLLPPPKSTAGISPLLPPSPLKFLDLGLVGRSEGAPRADWVGTCVEKSGPKMPCNSC